MVDRSGSAQLGAFREMEGRSRWRLGACRLTNAGAGQCKAEALAKGSESVGFVLALRQRATGCQMAMGPTLACGRAPIVLDLPPTGSPIVAMCPQ